MDHPLPTLVVCLLVACGGQSSFDGGAAPRDASIDTTPARPCVRVCNAEVRACPQDGPADWCAMQCETSLASAPGCEAEFAAWLACAEAATWRCAAQITDLATPSGCDAQRAAWRSCGATRDAGGDARADASSTPECFAARSGPTNVWTCTRDSQARERCNDGHIQREACAVGCLGFPSGTDDQCALEDGGRPAATMPACAPPALNAWSCSTDGMSRYRCNNARTETEACSHGCAPGAMRGYDARCVP